MSRVDLRLSGGSVLLPGLGLREADVLVGEERVLAITEPGAGAEAAETVSVTGLTVLPGGCDVHLHLGHGNDISRPRVPSDAATETAAAAIGGVTTFIPYVMSATPYAAQFEELRDVTQAGARIDFGFHLTALIGGLGVEGVERYGASTNHQMRRIISAAQLRQHSAAHGN